MGAAQRERRQLSGDILSNIWCQMLIDLRRTRHEGFVEEAGDLDRVIKNTEDQGAVVLSEEESGY